MAEALRLAPSLAPVVLRVGQLSVYAGSRPLLRGVDLEIRRGEIHGIIGPSGAGKSTLLKAFNRMVDLESPPLRVTGSIELCDKPIYGSACDPDELRRRVGILFQQPVIFPRSIRDNVLFGAVYHKRLTRRQREERLVRALTDAALWQEVEKRLDDPAETLSVGQQQRLCLARALAVGPELLLMDEPTSALDPRSTEAIEALIDQLKKELTIVLVTHDLGQARRVADVVSCICVRDGVGELVETACCSDMFSTPQCRETLDYIRQETDR